MGRPRQYSLDDLLDIGRSLWIEGGIDAVTVRAMVTRSGASNGALYHAFGARDGLLARIWAREARSFLELQRSIAEQALATGQPIEALVASALAPATYALQDEPGARLLLSCRGDDLDTPALDDEGRAQLRTLRDELGELFALLSQALWGRSDHIAITVVRHCLVDLPGMLLLSSETISDQTAQHSLRLAVRGVGSTPPPVDS